MRALGFQRDAIIGAEPGKYMLGITADGEWKIILGILRNVSAYQCAPEEKLPVSFYGTGDGITDIFLVENDGNVRFTFTHDGESNFVVTWLALSGGLPDMLRTATNCTGDGFSAILFDRFFDWFKTRQPQDGVVR